MTAAAFYKQYLPAAKAAEAEGGIPALAILAQCALETGYGKHAPGNMMFGIKAGAAWKGLRQLVTTHEVHDGPNVRYPEVISKTKQPNGTWRYKVKDWFRAYPTPKESFLDYASFIRKNPRYAVALTKKDPKEYLAAVAKAGYATDPNYYSTLCKVMEALTR